VTISGVSIGADQDPTTKAHLHLALVRYQLSVWGRFLRRNTPQSRRHLRDEWRAAHSAGREACGPYFDRRDFGLGAVPRFEQYRDFYFLNLDRDAVDLETYVASAKEYIDLVVDQSPTGRQEIASGTQENANRPAPFRERAT
jgi:hypothetical protein